MRSLAFLLLLAAVAMSRAEPTAEKATTAEKDSLLSDFVDTKKADGGGPSSWFLPKITTFKTAEKTIKCASVTDGQNGAGTAFGTCNAIGDAGQCGCTPGFATPCPPGSSIISCSYSQFPTFDPGADWAVGTSLLVPENNTCITIWVNVADIPRESTMRVSAVCQKLEKKGL